MFKLLAIGTLTLSLCAQSKPTFSVVNEATFQKNYLATSQSDKKHRRANQYQENLTVNMNWGKFTGSMTGRYVNYYKGESNQTLDRPDLALYRVNLKYSDGAYFAQAGDFNATLGNGLVLSVVQNDTTLDDRILRGGELSYQGSWLNLRAVAGSVNNNMRRLDDGTRNSLYKMNDVMGGEAKVKFLDGQWIGVHASQIDRTFKDKSAIPAETSLPRDRRRIVSVSLSGNNLFDLVDYSFEAARMSHVDVFSTVNHDGGVPPIYDPHYGRGIYANISMHPGSLMIMAEHRYYVNFDHELINPPSADRENEKMIKLNTRGSRLMAQYLFPNNLTVFGGVGYYQEGNLVTPANHDGTYTYGGFKMEDLFEKLTFGASYGKRTVQPFPSRYTEEKIQADVSYQLLPEWNAGLKSKSKENSDYKEWDLAGELAWSGKGALFVNRQYCTRVSTPTVEDPINPFFTNVLWNGGIRYNPWQGSTIELAGGKFRGGEACSGGPCRIVPSFKGWRLSSSLRF